MTDNWLPLPRYALRKHLVLDFLNRQSNKIQSCFELGYGSGDLMVSMAKMELTVSGFDFSSDAAAYARRRVDRCGPEVRRRVHILLAENQLREPVDAVIALEVMEHVKDDLKFLNRLHALVRPGGFLILSVPAHHSKWGENDVWAGHYRRYERNELVKKLTQTNYRTVHIWSYGFPLILFLDLMIHRNRKGEVKQLKGISKEELTRRSGISRDKNFINLLASSQFLLLPFFHIQKLFLHQDKTSAYLVIAQKTSI